MPLPRGTRVSISSRNWNVQPRFQSEIPAWSPFYQQDGASLDDIRKRDVISLDDILAPDTPSKKSPVYRPIIDQQALQPFDQRSKTDFNGGRKGLQQASAKKGIVQRAEDFVGNIFAPATTSRGITNNNPGNIEYGRTAKSYGAIGAEPKGRFAVFNSPEEGISSIYRLQDRYEKNGYQTIAQRVNKWAPPGENDSKSYAKAVAKAMGIDTNTPFSIRDKTLGPAFVNALIQHENGTQPYSTQQIDDARHLIDVPSPQEQARELQAQQARVGRPSLGPLPPAAGNAVAGIFNSPPKSNAPDFDKMSPEELDSFIESKKTAILGTVANNPQLALDPHFADQLDKAGIIPKNAPPLTGTAQAGSNPSVMAAAQAPLNMAPQALSGQGSPSPAPPMPSASAGQIPLNALGQLSGSAVSPQMPSPMASGAPQIRPPMGLTGSAVPAPPAPQPNATGQLGNFGSPFSPGNLMSATPDQRISMALGPQQKPLAAPPVSLGPVNATAPGPPPGASQEARGPVPIGVGPMSVSATGGWPSIPSASADAGRMPITPPPVAASGMVGQNALSPLGPINAVRPGGPPGMLPAAPMQTTVAGRPPTPPMTGFPSTPMLPGDFAPDPGETPVAPKGNLQAGPFPPMMTSPGVPVAPPNPVQSVSFPRAPGAPVPTNIPNVIQPYGFTPPPQFGPPMSMAPAPPAPPAPPSIQGPQFGPPMSLATKRQVPPKPIQSILPALPGVVQNPALAPPAPPPASTPALLPQLAPQKKLTPQQNARLKQLLNGSGMPLGNNAGWNGGGMGQVGLGMTGGWGGLFGNGTGLGGPNIGFGTGGAINPNR